MLGAWLTGAARRGAAGGGRGLAAGVPWRIFRFGNIFHVIAWKILHNRKSFREMV
jgi:hypothetical protein